MAINTPDDSTVPHSQPGGGGGGALPIYHNNETIVVINGISYSAEQLWRYRTTAQLDEIINLLRRITEPRQQQQQQP
jgi:hypothetical protein